ncbi:MAG: hypothetical protein ACMUIL_13320 [bacterium]
MKREHIFENNFNRFIVYSVCIIVTFISFLALSSNISAQDYNLSYLQHEWGLLPVMSYQYSPTDVVFDYDQYISRVEPLNPGMATALYTYSHLSGAGLQNTYLYNVYTNPGVSATPARLRNTVFEFWMNTGGQSGNPGSGTNIWFPQSPSRSKPSPSPRMPFPIPDYWGFSASPIGPSIYMDTTWTSIGGGLSSPPVGLWSPQGGYGLGFMSGISF